MSNHVFDVFCREIERIKKTKFILIMLFVYPVVLAVLIFSVLGSASPKDLPLAVYDMDNTQLSRKLSRMIDATTSVEVKYKLSDSISGEKMLRSGDIYGFVVIPSDFSKDVMLGRSPQVPFYYNNQMLLVGGIVSKDVILATQTLIGQLRAAKIMKQGHSINYAKDNINLIEIDEHIRSNPYLNYSYFLGMGFFFQIFQMLIAFCAIWAMGVELKKGSAKEWFEVAGNSVWNAFLGKILPYFLVFFVTFGLVYIYYLIRFGGVFLGNAIALLLATIFFIFAYQAIGMMFVAWFGNMRLALSGGAFYTAMGFAFVGVTYPHISMPTIAMMYGSLMPLTYYLRIFIGQSIRKIPLIYDFHNYLAIIILTLFAIAFLPLLKKRALCEEDWYKL